MSPTEELGPREGKQVKKCMATASPCRVANSPLTKPLNDSQLGGQVFGNHCRNDLEVVWVPTFLGEPGFKTYRKFEVTRKVVVAFEASAGPGSKPKNRVVAIPDGLSFGGWGTSFITN